METIPKWGITMVFRTVRLVVPAEKDLVKSNPSKQGIHNKTCIIYHVSFVWSHQRTPIHIWYMVRFPLGGFHLLYSLSPVQSSFHRVMTLPKTVIFAIIYLFIYLFIFWLCQVWVVACNEIFNLCYSTWTLFFFFLVTRELLVEVCGIWFPDQESNLGPLNWELRLLTTGPPGKSP